MYTVPFIVLPFFIWSMCLPELNVSLEESHFLLCLEGASFSLFLSCSFHHCLLNEGKTTVKKSICVVIEIITKNIIFEDSRLMVIYLTIPHWSIFIVRGSRPGYHSATMHKLTQWDTGVMPLLHQPCFLKTDLHFL